MLCKPFVHTGQFLFLFAVCQFVGGQGKCLIAQAEGIDEGKNAADKRLAQQGIFLGKPLLFNVLCGDRPVFIAERSGGAGRTHHHDALHQGLTADRRNFLCHSLLSSFPVFVSKFPGFSPGLVFPPGFGRWAERW